MNVNQYGLMDADQVISQGQEVPMKKALEITNAASSVIAEENKRSWRAARFMNLHDGWKYIWQAVSNHLPTQSHALVVVWQTAQSEPYAEVLVGHHANVHIDTLSRASQWIHLHSQEANNHRFFIVNLSD